MEPEITACMFGHYYCDCYDCNEGAEKIREKVGIEMRRRLKNDRRI